MHQINTSPINSLIQQIRTAEFSNQKDVRISIQQARLLSLALVELLDALYKPAINVEPPIVKITMDGGEFG